MADIPSEEQLQQQYEEQSRLNAQGVLDNRPVEYKRGEGSFAGEFFRTLAGGGSLTSAIVNGAAAGLDADWYAQQQQDIYLKRADAWNSASKNVMTARTEVDRKNAENVAGKSSAEVENMRNKAIMPRVGELTQIGVENEIAKKRLETETANTSLKTLKENDEKKNVEDRISFFVYNSNQENAQNQHARNVFGQNYSTYYPVFQYNKNFNQLQSAFNDIRTVSLAMRGNKYALDAVKQDIIPRLKREGVNVVEENGKFYLVSGDGETREEVSQETMIKRYKTLLDNFEKEKEAYGIIWGGDGGVAGLMMKKFYTDNTDVFERFGYHKTLQILNGAVFYNPTVGPERLARAVLINAIPKLKDTDNDIDAETRKAYQEQCIKLGYRIGAKYDPQTNTDKPIIFHGERMSEDKFYETLKREEDSDPGSVTATMKHVVDVQKAEDRANAEAAMAKENSAKKDEDEGDDNAPGKRSDGSVSGPDSPIDKQKAEGNLKPDGTLIRSAVAFKIKHLPFLMNSDVSANTVAGMIPVYYKSLKNLSYYAKEDSQYPGGIDVFSIPDEVISHYISEENTGVKRTGYEDNLEGTQGVWTTVKKAKSAFNRIKKIEKEIEGLNNTETKDFDEKQKFRFLPGGIDNTQKRNRIKQLEEEKNGCLKEYESCIDRINSLFNFF